MALITLNGRQFTIDDSKKIYSQEVVNKLSRDWLRQYYDYLRGDSDGWFHFGLYDLDPGKDDLYNAGKLSEVSITAKKPTMSNYLAQNAKKNWVNEKEQVGQVVKTGLSFIPYVGDALDVYDAYNNAKLGNYGAALAGIGLLAVPNALEKPLKAGYKFIKKSDPQKLLNNLYKFIGGHSDGPSVSSMRHALNPLEIEQLELLEAAGVDLNDISIDDLRNMRSERLAEIQKKFGVYNLIDKVGPSVYDVEPRINFGRTRRRGLGRFVEENGEIFIDDVESWSDPGAGVMEQVFNSGINLAHSRDLKGLTSGKYLLSAPKNYHLWGKYPNKTLISLTGSHSNTMMVDVDDDAIEKLVNTKNDLIEATKNNTLAHRTNGEIMLLELPSTTNIVAKSTSFDPNIIDDNGFMNIEWNNPNVYRSLLLPGLFLTSVSNKEYKSGGTIHIKKENRGKFTDYCGGKVTEECIRKGKNSSNPTTRQRANFAWVARHKFKHEEGGKINYLNMFNENN